VGDSAARLHVSALLAEIVRRVGGRSVGKPVSPRNHDWSAGSGHPLS
jgi:hypothetical protein